MTPHEPLRTERPLGSPVVTTGEYGTRVRGVGVLVMKKRGRQLGPN
ncbi:MAG: hypothetical protein JO086_01225 [Acidimicrobiia bacterium]|nr:hypothetical protein [Acidimicrobiia bacterium]